MIYAFAEVQQRVPDARLYILGDVDDEPYQKECLTLVDQLGIRNLYFTGIVDVRQYYPRFDFTILTSISEGQPLCILEALRQEDLLWQRMWGAAGNCAKG